jgi:hypothetical protein
VSRAAGKGQEQNSFRRDAAFEKNADSGRKRCGLPGSGSRDDSERPVTKRGGLSLLRVELSLGSEHMFDSKIGVLQPKDCNVVEQSLESDTP